MKETMDVFERLKSDHRKVEKIFERLLKTKESDSEKRRNGFAELHILLSAHADAEESLFYPITEDIKSTKDLTLEAYEEHQIAKTLLADLEQIDPSDDLWHAKMKVLSEMVKHHVKEEEEELFPKAKKAFDKESSLELGLAVEAFEEEELQKAS